MNHILPFSQYVALIQGLSMSDVKIFHKDEARIMKHLHRCHHRTDVATYVVSYLNGGEYLFLNKSFGWMAEIPLAEAYERGVKRSQEQLFAPDREVHHNCIFPEYLEKFKDIPADTHHEYVMKSHYRVHCKSGGFKTLLQESRFIKSTEDGRPLVAYGYLFDISTVATGNTIGMSIVSETKPQAAYRNTYYSNVSGVRLSERQVEIIQLTGEGFTVKEIAAKLHLSKYTIENHHTKIRELTNAKSAAQMVYYACKHGYLN